MAIQHKYDNGLTGWSSGPSPTIAYSYGTPFRVSAACGLTELSWYRAATGTPAPISLRLYRRDTSGLLTQAPAVPDSGSVGWQTYTLPAAIGLVTGVDYMVTAGFNLGGGEPYKIGTSFPTLPSGFAATTNYRYYTEGSNTYPATGDTSYFYGLDVEIDTSITPAEPPPITTGDIGAELAPWLSSDPEAQTHETDGLPWQTHALAAGLDDKVGETSDTASSSGSLFSRTAELLGRTGELLLRLPADILNDIQSAGQQTLSWLGIGEKPVGAPTIPQQITDVNDLVSFVGAQVTDLAEQVTGLTALVSSPREPLAGFPTEFDLVDSFSFTDCLAWNVAADVYVLHCTTLPARLALSPICGINMIPRLGWWAPLADTLPGSRRFLDFEYNLIYDASGRLPGVMVELGEGGEATIEAYVSSP